jgi:hypothetical protein
MAKIANTVDVQEALSSKMIVSIDGQWTAAKFSTFFDSTLRLYRYYLLWMNTIYSLERIKQEMVLPNRPETNEIFEKFTMRHFREDFMRKVESTFLDKNPDDPDIALYGIGSKLHTDTLDVTRVSYASPGSIDFAGLGKIFEQMKEMVFFYLPNKEKKVDVELKEQELLSMKIDNLKKMGYKPTEIRSIIGLESHHVEKLSRLADSGNITDVKIIIVDDGSRTS